MQGPNSLNKSLVRLSLDCQTVQTEVLLHSQDYSGPISQSEKGL